MNLTEHFTLEELTHTDHRELENIPNENELYIILRKELTKMRDYMPKHEHSEIHIGYVN